jgi:two-component system, NarL family, sensor histidine kinase DegS
MQVTDSVASEAPTTSDLKPTAVLHETLEREIARTEAEIARFDDEQKIVRGRLDQGRERCDAADTVRTLVLKNVAQYSPDEIRHAFDEHAAALAEVAVADHSAKELALRREQAEEHLKWLRLSLDTVDDVVSDANVQSPEEEALTFRNASRQVFQIIEEERMRIARDMHDGPAQSMSNLVLQAEILERLVDRPEAVMSELQDFKRAVRSALDETRQLIFDLRPMTLDDLGLVPTLRKYLREYSDKYGIPVRFNLVGDERRLPGATEGTLFRIIQEALTNVQKHARAHSAEVTMTLAKERVAVNVRDDGVGFDLPAVEASLARNRNLGLISMRERAELERGVLEVRTMPGKGTEIRVEFRLQ